MRGMFRVGLFVEVLVALIVEYGAVTAVRVIEILMRINARSRSTTLGHS